MLNHIEIMGRFTRDPELRRTGSGTAVASFTLACERDFKNQDGTKDCDFIDCVAWKNTAEFIEKSFTKGRLAVVCGSLQIRTWKDKDGNNRKTAEVIVSNIYFADSRPANGAQSPIANPENEDYAVMEDEDAVLPF